MSFFFSVPPPEKRRGCPGVCVPRTEVAWFVSADGHRWLRGPFPPGQSEAFGMSPVWEKPQPRKEKPGREGKGSGAVPEGRSCDCHSTLTLCPHCTPHRGAGCPKCCSPFLGPSFGAGWGPPEVLRATSPLLPYNMTKKNPTALNWRHHGAAPRCGQSATRSPPAPCCPPPVPSHPTGPASLGTSPPEGGLRPQKGFNKGKGGLGVSPLAGRRATPSTGALLLLHFSFAQASPVSHRR